jgi:hypothetical protein
LPSNDALEAGVAALRRLRSNGDHVVLFRPGALGGDPSVKVAAVKRGDHRRRSASIHRPNTKEVTWADVVVSLQSLGWSLGEPTATGLEPTYVARTYAIRTDADLVQIAEDAHTALDFLMPSRFGQPLEGARFGPYSDSEILLLGCILSVPLLLVGLAVGSVVLLLLFPSAWSRGPNWAAAIAAAVLGTYLVPWLLVTATKSSDRLTDYAQAIQQVGLLVLPALIAGVVLVVASVAF